MSEDFKGHQTVTIELSIGADAFKGEGPAESIGQILQQWFVERHAPLQADIDALTAKLKLANDRLQSEVGKNKPAS